MCQDHLICLSLPFHAIANEILSISIVLFFRQQTVSQQTLWFILEGWQVSSWAGCIISPPGCSARAGGHVRWLWRILIKAPSLASWDNENKLLCILVFMILFISNITHSAPKSGGQHDLQYIYIKWRWRESRLNIPLAKFTDAVKKQTVLKQIEVLITYSFRFIFTYIFINLSADVTRQERQFSALTWRIHSHIRCRHQSISLLPDNKKREKLSFQKIQNRSLIWIWVSRVLFLASDTKKWKTAVFFVFRFTTKKSQFSAALLLVLGLTRKTECAPNHKQAVFLTLFQLIFIVNENDKNRTKQKTADSLCLV